MRFFKLGAVCISIILVSLSCSNESIFPSMSTEAFGVSIEIENNMSRISQGDVLNFSIVNKEDTQVTQTFRALLYKADGTLVADKTVSDLETVNYAPEIAVPELEDGFYYFECTVSDSENELVKLRKEFFVYNKPAAIGSLSSYPPVIFPGGGALLSASISGKDNDPFIRWTLGGQIYSEGYYSDGYDQQQWQAPSQNGIYKMAVELYPDRIPSGFTQPLEGVSYTETQLFVSKDQEPDKNELQALEGSFSSLFHFRGEFQDYLNEGKSAVPLGNPVIALESHMFGYQLTNSAGFRLDYSILPATDDLVTPFTVFLKGKIKNTEGKTYILRSASSSTAFEIFFNSERKLSALLFTGGKEFASVMDADIDPADINNFALTVIPGLLNTEFRWFSDGKQVSQNLAGAVESAKQSESGAWTEIAGDNGVDLFIDELGVFYRDSLGRNAPSPAVFLGAAKELYADKLLFADGFDGIWFLPEYSQDRTAKLEAGSLVLAGDDSIILDDLVLPPNTSSIDLLWNSSQSGSVRFQFSSSGQDSEIVVDYTNRRMIVAGKPAALPSGQTTVGKITLALRNNKLVLLSGRNEYPLLVTGPDGITLKISNPGEETFYLDDIVILKETEAIIRNSENSLEKSPELI